MDPWGTYAAVGANRREVTCPQNFTAELAAAVDRRVQSGDECSRDLTTGGEFNNAPVEPRDDRPSTKAADPAERTTDDRDEPKTKRYSYAGPPKISLSTWNERPKRQVSIKTDRDYVIGIRQRLQQKANAEPTTTKPKDYSAESSPQVIDNKCATAAAAVSRVPVVKSVELKKPYAEQLQTASPVLALAEAIKAQAKLSNGYGGYHRGNTIAGSYRGNGPVATATRVDCENATAATTRPSEKKKESDSGGSSYTFGKLMNRPRKPREISVNVDPRQNLLESIRSFGGRDNLRKIRG